MAEKTQAVKAVTIRKTFSRQTSVSIPINADASIIWALLTDAAGYARWNPTVVSITGSIGAGEKIKLVSRLAPNRAFKLKVKIFEAPRRLVWGDAMGERVFTIANNGSEAALFTMDEKIGGPLFSLFAGMIPSFDSSFEQFATALKNEAENIMQTK